MVWWSPPEMWKASMPSFSSALGQGDGILDGEAVRLIVGAAQADGHREVRAHLLPHVPHDLDVDPHPVLQAAAVEVGAVVGGGGEEVCQQVSVGAVDLHQFKARHLGPEGRVAEGVDDVLDLLDGQHMGHRLDAVLIPQLGPGNGGGRADGLGAQELLPAAVLDLDGRDGALLPDVLRQPGEAGDVLVAGDAQVAVGGLGADVVHIGVLHNDHAGAAGRLLPVVPDQPLGDRAVHIAHSGGLRCFHHTVLQFERPDLSRGEQVRKHLACHSFFLLISWMPPAAVFRCKNNRIDKKKAISYDTISRF